MSQNYQFVESLIQLRSHYQSLTNEYERSSCGATEQLNHVNALLVDQFSENQQFVDSLLQLRSHYQALHQEHQQKAVHAREQLNHVNALLADQAVLQHREQQPYSIQATTLEQQALTGAIADNSEEPPQQEPEVVQEPEPIEVSKQQIAKDSSQGEQIEEKPSPQEMEPLEASEQQISSSPIQVEQQPEPELTIELPDVEDSSERSRRHSALLKTPLLPQYEHLNKSEAVEKLLQENEGRVLHVDYIIRALYGELEPEEIKAEKPRMNDSLKKGIAKGLWERVPDSPGYYTADMKLVDKEVDSKKVEAKQRQARKPNSEVTEGMLPRYRNLNFTEAVETVVRDRSGEVVAPDIVARALYGELERSALVEAKKKVGKTLWAGANQGRWQSVPGRLGAYTLDMKLID